MRRLMAIMLLGLAVAGCRGIIPGSGGAAPGQPPASGPAPAAREAISYEAGPCFGSCPVYSFTVSPDGRGHFTGKNFTTVTGERSFELTPAQYDALAAALAPYRPTSGDRSYHNGQPGCERWATDMPSVEVRWAQSNGDRQRLYYDFGCNVEDRRMADALGNAPDLIPALAPLIGARP